MNQDDQVNNQAQPQTADPWTQNPPQSSTQSSKENANDNQRAWKLVDKLASSALVEQRRARRWGILFKSLTFIWLFAVLWMIYNAANWQNISGMTDTTHTAIVQVKGMIADGSDASADKIIRGLRAAMKNESSKGVILHINSPGGSAVQAGQVYDEVMRLRKSNPDKPIYAVVSDLCASGGYYIAAAAKEIYADKASMVGSIGVRADSFGFVEAMQKLGIERRLYTAGENKALLDPFTPEKAEDIAILERLLDKIHQQFITAVKQGRGGRINDSQDIYSGLVWTGEESVKLGLIDGLGSLRYVAEELIGVKKLKDYTPRSRLIDQLIEVSVDKIGQVFSSMQMQSPVNLQLQ